MKLFVLFYSLSVTEARHVPGKTLKTAHHVTPSLRVCWSWSPCI